MDILKDQAWQGVAGIIAAITLAIMVMDRKKGKRSKDPSIILVTYGYFLFGCTYAVFPMVAGMIIGAILSSFGFELIVGHYGDIGYTLSQIHFLYWGFNPRMSVIEAQLGAIGLWLGGISCGLIFATARFIGGYTIDKMPRYLIYVPIASSFMIISVGLIGVGTSIATGVWPWEITPPPASASADGGPQ